MWNVLCESLWKQEITTLEVSIFFQPDFINPIAHAYGLNINYLGYELKGENIALFALFSKGKNIYMPQANIYSAFYIKSGISENNYFTINETLIKYLKEKYRSILLRLEPAKIDIRPFIWNGFKVDVRYTHIKVRDNNYHASIYKNLRKGSVQAYTFKVENVNNQSKKLNIDFLREIGVRSQERESYNVLLNNSAVRNYYKAFNVYKDDELICSNIAIVDPESKTVYTILLNNVKKQEKYAHTFLYSSLIQWCFQNGINKIDLCGANMKNISIFKSYFNTDLVIYFNLSYSSSLNKMLFIPKKLFSFLNRLR